MQTVSDTQRQLEGLDHSDVEYRPLLVELLNRQDLRSHVQSLYGSDLEGFVEFLDKVGKVDVDIRTCADPPSLGSEPHSSHR